jgi:hypothetical protein
LENSQSAIFYSGFSDLQNFFIFRGVTGNIRKINNKNLLKIEKNTIFGETTVTMETILCSRILQIVSTKYLIYTRECLKLIDEVIKFINWNFYAIRYLYYGTVWSHLNCTGSGHRASECKSRSKCRVCDGKHHSSICEKPPKENLMTTNQGNEQHVVYPVVVVDVHGVKCRALLDSGSGSSYASAVLLKTIGVKLGFSRLC